MDASAFEASAPDDPDPPISDVVDLMMPDDDIKYAIAVAVAVIKHVVKLVVLVVALSMCVTIYCFTFSWLCLLYLQTRLFIFTSAMLRRCMHEPRRVQSVDVGHSTQVRQPDGSSIKDSQRVSDDSAEKVQDAVNHTGKPFEGSVSSEDPAGPGKALSRPQLHEEWREATVDDQGRASQSGNNVDGAAAIAKASTSASDYYPGWSSSEEPHQPSSDLDFSQKKQGTSHENDDGHVVQPPSKPKATTTAVQQSQVPVKPKAPNPQEKSGQEHQGWLQQLTFTAPHHSNSTAAQKPSPATTTAPQAARATRGGAENVTARGFTTAQLAEAIDFANEIKGSQTARSQNKPPRGPSRFTGKTVVGTTTGKPSTSAPSKPVQPVKTHTGNRPIPSIGAARPVQAGSGGNEADSATNYVPRSLAPHVKKQMAERAKAQKAAAEGNPLGAHHQPSAASTIAKDKTEENQAPSAAKASNDDIQNVASEQLGRGSKVIEHKEDKIQITRSEQTEGPMETPSPESSSGPQKLDFYDGTPVLKNPAWINYSAETLRALGAASTPEIEVQRARIQNSDAGSFMFKQPLPTTKSPQDLPKYFWTSTNDPKQTAGLSVRSAQKSTEISEPSKTPNEKQSVSPLRLLEQDAAEEIKLDAQDDESHQCESLPMPSAAEFAAVENINDVKQRENTATSSESLNDINKYRVEGPSSSQRSMIQQAYREVVDKIYPLRPSTSTYATVPEDATSTHPQDSHEGNAPLVETQIAGQTLVKKSRHKSSGGRSSKLTAEAPAFFAPRQPSARTPPVQPYAAAGTANATASQAMPFSSHFQTSPRAHMRMAWPYEANANSFNVSQPQHVTMPSNPCAPAHGNVSFGQRVPTRYTSGGVYGGPRMSGYSTIPLPGISFFGNSGLSPHGSPSTASEMPYNGSSQSMGGTGLVLPNRQAPRPMPIRSPSLAVPPPSSVRPFDLPQMFPQLSSAPAPVPGQAPKVRMPPGLGEPQPARQASFDALLSEPGDSPPVKAEGLNGKQVAGSSKETKDVSHSMKESINETVSDKAQQKRLLADSFREFSANLKMPPLSPLLEEENRPSLLEDHLPEPISKGKGKAKMTDPPVAQEDSSDSEEAPRQLSEVERPRGFPPKVMLRVRARKVKKKSIYGLNVQDTSSESEELDRVPFEAPSNAGKQPQSAAAVQETASNEQAVGSNEGEAGNTSATKRSRQEEKKAARKALTEAWCDREEARKKMNTFSLEKAINLRDVTGVYHERRDKLASLMASKKLNEEDEGAFPRFGEMELRAPTVKPNGAAEIQQKRKEQKAAADIAGGTNDKTAAGSTLFAPPEDSKLEQCKKKLIGARKLRQQALGRALVPPGESQSYVAAREAAVSRATHRYRKMRAAFVEACTGGEMPEDMVAEFPLV